MKNALVLLSVFVLSGCIVRTYPLTRDRIDQDLTAGNRGYLKGEPSPSEGVERKTQRTTQVIEVELGSPIKFGGKAKVKTAQTTEVVETGNRGYIQETEITPQEEAPAAITGNFEKYTVQKNETLQKISQKFYGTTKKWTKIYDANRDILKGPDKIYPGQVINIPVEGLKEPAENLK